MLMFTYMSPEIISYTLRNIDFIEFAHLRLNAWSLVTSD